MSNLDRLNKSIRTSNLNNQNTLPYLNEIANEIRKYSIAANSEASIRQYFTTKITQILKYLFNFDYNPSLEVQVERQITTFNGRIDSLFGNLIIEFKHPKAFSTPSERTSAKEQLVDYIKGLQLKDLDTQWFGFITDGINIEGIIANEDGLSSSGIKSLSGSSIKRILEIILQQDTINLSSKNLIRLLSEDKSAQEISPIKQLAKALFNAISKHSVEKTIMLFQEWESIFRLAHNDKSKQSAIQRRKEALASYFQISLSNWGNSEIEYSALFSMQTAYAISVKLIAYRVLAKIKNRQSASWDSLLNSDSNQLLSYIKQVESGDLFRQEGFFNLIESDYFSWYASDLQWNTEISSAIQRLLSILSSFSRSSVLSEAKIGDLFKELYQSVMPFEVRHCLGEFYTPAWLADKTIDDGLKLVNTKNWRALDPCCGSGTFIVRLITKVLEQNKDKSNAEKLNAVLTRVKGFDLNPLAALSARINYFLLIADLLPENGSGVDIPIYLGDASCIPTRTQIASVSCFEYNIKTAIKDLHVIFPCSILKDLQSFSTKISSIEQYILFEDEESVFQEFINILPEKEKNVPELFHYLKDLSSELVFLQKKKWNGIWARIIYNFFSTIAIGKFDLIVGNPPWIDWKNLPNNYRDRIKSLCIEQNLFSGDRLTGGINLNICALITHVCLQNWLSEKGTLAFLMPENMIFQQTYEGFRKLNVGKNEFYFNKLTDWNNAAKPFDQVGMRFLAYYINNEKKDYSLGIPVQLIIKKKSSKTLKEYTHCQTFSSVQDLFNTVEATAGTVSGRTGFTYATSTDMLKKFQKIAGDSTYIGREGVEFFPQELLLFKYKRSIGNLIVIENIQVTKSKYKIPKSEQTLENKYFYPLIKGINVERFHLTFGELGQIFVPFPYDPIVSFRVPIDRKLLAKESPHLLSYFTKNRKVFDSQTDYNDRIIGSNRTKEFYSLARVGSYSFAKWFVAFRDNTSWQSCVVGLQSVPWSRDRKMPVFQNHCAYISQDNEGQYISEDEAHFICAIFNAPIIKKFIESSSDSRTFKIRPPINVPKFDPSNNIHKKLSAFSKLAHNNFADSKAIKVIDEKLDSLVLELASTISITSDIEY